MSAVSRAPLDAPGALARFLRLRVPQVRRPALLVVTGFAAAILVGTGLLTLPAATEGEGGAGLFTALFTATSAVCVTGLILVDTPSYWSAFGELTILGLIQLGGFGIMTFASLLGLLVFRRLGLSARITAQTETKSLGLGEVRGVVVGVAKTSALFEAVVATLLAARFALGYDEPFGRAVYLGIFHAVSAFNNAGFALFSGNLTGFVGDPWICLPIAAAVIAGGLGFPVLFELRRELRTPARWSLHTRITLTSTAALLVSGTAVVLALEWTNPDTLGALATPSRLLAAFFQAVMPRTAGFNSLDYGHMTDATLLFTDVLMFIGGGSAGTAGGIKVTTLMVLGFIILAEVRGDTDVHTMWRRIPEATQRQALTVALLGVALVVGATLALLALTSYRLGPVLFEVVSAFGTAGLSTGITARLPPLAQCILIVLMFAGRLGPVTVASALALRERGRRYQLPEERPIVG